ncbi:MAG: type VI secretion system-associated protein TagF [Chloroflexota bacterium]
MLGSVTTAAAWRWAASGKHPVSADFFRAGKEFPLLKGFSDWIENGYQYLARKNRPLVSLHSWRFWVRGGARDVLACGLVRDSSDSLGRPYPLLIMGSGALKDWDQQWDLLPFACERTWNRMEYIAAQGAREFRSFEQDIERIRPPDADWAAFAAKGESFCRSLAESEGSEGCLAPGEIERLSEELAVRAESFLPFDGTGIADQTALIVRWHSRLRAIGREAPSAAFMGGTMEKSCLAFFKRPLVAEDFGRLWAVEGG